MAEWWTRAQGEGADAYLDRVIPVLVEQIAALQGKVPVGDVWRTHTNPIRRTRSVLEVEPREEAVSTPWPERTSYNNGMGDTAESDALYLIRMVQQLFVEIAQVKAMLEKPLYQINPPPHAPTVSEILDSCRQDKRGDLP